MSRKPVASAVPVARFAPLRVRSLESVYFVRSRAPRVAVHAVVPYSSTANAHANAASYLMGPCVSALRAPPSDRSSEQVGISGQGAGLRRANSLLHLQCQCQVRAASTARLGSALTPNASPRRASHVHMRFERPAKPPPLAARTSIPGPTNGTDRNGLGVACCLDVTSGYYASPTSPNSLMCKNFAFRKDSGRLSTVRTTSVSVFMLPVGCTA